MLVLLCCLSAILTSRKNKRNHIRNFSESTLSQKTKLAAELTYILKFINIIKSIWGKLYSSHGCWRHPRQVAKNYKIGNFEGSSIWLKQALDREYQLQKHFLSSYLLSTFDWLGFGQRIWWNINWNKAYLATFGNFFRMLLSYSMGLSSVRSLHFLDQILHRL